MESTTQSMCTCQGYANTSYIICISVKIPFSCLNVFKKSIWNYPWYSQSFLFPPWAVNKPGVELRFLPLRRTSVGKKQQNYRDIPPNEQWMRPMDITGCPLWVEWIANICQQSAAPLLGAFAEKISIYFSKQTQKKRIKNKNPWMGYIINCTDLTLALGSLTG